MSFVGEGGEREERKHDEHKTSMIVLDTTSLSFHHRSSTSYLKTTY